MFLLSRRALVLIAVFSLSACSAATSTSTAEQSTEEHTLGVEPFRALVESPGVVVLDVRTPHEYAEGHLTEAINIDFTADSFVTEVSQLDREATYAVYCRSGNRSQQALTKMTELGFVHLSHLDGGFDAWRSAGLPVVR